MTKANRTLIGDMDLPSAAEKRASRSRAPIPKVGGRAIGTYSPCFTVAEHLLLGKPLTHLEAMTCYGERNLYSVVERLRRKGFDIAATYVPYSKALKRINHSAMLAPPASLPVEELELTEYRRVKA